MPGFIDLHVHFRDPGLEYKETLKTGGEAAARGGVTTVCAMPNTKPVIDTKEKVEEVHRRAKEESPVHVIQLGAITVGEEGKELADIKGMAEAGCIALSEDGKSVMNSALYREGMKIAKKYGLRIFAHCEEIDLRRDPDTGEDGVMNKCEKSEELGLPGITNSVEDIITARDIFLAKDTGVHLHLCHCSTKGTVDLMRMAKEEGVSVSAEVCPHHFILSTDDITEDHGRFKIESATSGDEGCGGAPTRYKRGRHGGDFHRPCTSFRRGKGCADEKSRLWNCRTGDERISDLYRACGGRRTHADADGRADELCPG